MATKELYLDERIDMPVAVHPPLPYFHTCEAIHLPSILANGQLDPRHCDVYDENLLYLFYGKPAYKPAQEKSSGFLYMMPVCFIVRHDAFADTDIQRILAFDSGAFPLYEDHLHSTMTRRQFEISPSKASINKMLHWFFQNNDSYYRGTAGTMPTYDPIHFPVESYVSIISTKHKAEADDRKSCFEVQLKNPIPINGSTIEAIILPKHLAESPSVKKMITDALKINTISITNYAVPAKNYHVDILEKTKEYLVDKKLLNGY